MTKLRKLREQAWSYAKEQKSENYQTLLGFFEDKFAELIVRECANQCDLLLDHKISSEWARGTHDCSRAIKQHFGVEE